MKALILFLFWFPNTLRCLWREQTGRYFIFRDEPVEFVRYMQWVHASSEDNPNSNLKEFFEQLEDEITARRRQGTM